MVRFGSIRLAEVLDVVSAAERERLCGRYDIPSEALLSERLGATAHIRARALGLGYDGKEHLRSLLNVHPETLSHAFIDEPPDDLIEAALAFQFEMDGAQVLAIPLEVRIALADGANFADAELPVILALRDEDVLEELAELHGVTIEDCVDELDAVIRVTDAIVDPERLRDIYSSMLPPSRRLLLWFCEMNEPVRAEVVEAVAANLAEQRGEGGMSTLRVLLRLGVVQCVSESTEDNSDDPSDASEATESSMIGEREELYVVPPDVWDALVPTIEAELSIDCADAYQQLRDASIPAFRDVFPRGYGGAPLLYARLRLMSCTSVGPDPHDRMDRLLSILRIYDTDRSEIGELAALHIDVSGPDVFARESLRAWLMSLADSFSEPIIAAFGGDLARAMEGIDAGLAIDESPDGDPARARDAWGAITWSVRAHLIFVLGLLSAGHWYPMRALAIWFVGLYRRERFNFGDTQEFHPVIARDAIPVPASHCAYDIVPRVQDALTAVFHELMGPLGAVAMDPSSDLFMVNPEALRVFRDGDFGFARLWDTAHGYLEDDTDLWLPLPTDSGSRVCGVASCEWVGGGVLELGTSPHLADLELLVVWATPILTHDRIAFAFDAASVRRGADTHLQEELLAWLVARTGAAIPDEIRALFLVSTTPTDGGDAASTAYIAHLVDGTIEQIESWADHPPAYLLATLRSWGPAALPQILATVIPMLDRGDWSNPMLAHLLIVLGEIGDPVACPALLRAIGFSEDDLVEVAAATACARMGEPAIEGLRALMNNSSAAPEKRLTAVTAMSTAAVLHPHLCVEAVTHIGALLNRETFAPDIATLIAVCMAETGHRSAEQVLYDMKERGLWEDAVISFDEALWVASLSPAAWGMGPYAGQLANAYPTRLESQQMRLAAGVEAMIRESGVAEERLLGRIGARPAKPKKKD